MHLFVFQRCAQKEVTTKKDDVRDDVDASNVEAAACNVAKPSQTNFIRSLCESIWHLEFIKCWWFFVPVSTGFLVDLRYKHYRVKSISKTIVFCKKHSLILIRKSSKRTIPSWRPWSCHTVDPNYPSNLMPVPGTGPLKRRKSIATHRLAPLTAVLWYWRQNFIIYASESHPHRHTLNRAIIIVMKSLHNLNYALPTKTRHVPFTEQQAALDVLAGALILSLLERTRYQWPWFFRCTQASVCRTWTRPSCRRLWASMLDGHLCDLIAPPLLA